MTYYYEADSNSGSNATAWDECYLNATSEADALTQLESRGVNVTHIEQVQD
jgi:DNA-dependent RNA polymerase auxiliary subunit epsilon